jgi:hypothetical protein
MLPVGPAMSTTKFETMLMAGPLGALLVGLEPRGVWRLRSLLLPGDEHGAPGHMATPEPSPGEWRAWCLGARGDTEAFFWQVARSVSWGTWRHRSPLLVGGVLGASGHVAEPEPPGTRNGSGAVGLIF